MRILAGYDWQCSFSTSVISKCSAGSWRIIIIVITGYGTYGSNHISSVMGSAGSAVCAGIYQNIVSEIAGIGGSCAVQGIAVQCAGSWSSG